MLADRVLWGDLEPANGLVEHVTAAASELVEERDLPTRGRPLIAELQLLELPPSLEPPALHAVQKCQVRLVLALGRLG